MHTIQRVGARDLIIKPSPSPWSGTRLTGRTTRWPRPRFDELVGPTHPLAELDMALDEASSGLFHRVGVEPGRRLA
ncbi:hypothetical protein [Agromyces sp. Marseille-P2726]|uniref:hypothetical protein n=1 Tax=Agromyces sp. Marseille-P2726 TaxID=2709132 RepID=UPI00156E3383|nr:hypothetical protein [Agromyces sp. Marseille-P2726]